MKKKIFVIALVCLALVMTGCKKEQHRQSALDFKSEYEAVNDKTARGDLKYRSLSISEDNPYVKITPKEVVEKLENKETFYLYVGDPLCPWCRSGLEKMIEVAMNNDIKDIYYIDFWDDNHKEILRDLYEVDTTGKKAKLVKTQDATEEYLTILDYVKDFAQEYVVTKDGKDYNVGEKRTMGGDHFYFENGVCKRYVSLRSDKLAGAFDELTKEVLEDQEANFKQFFTNQEVCDGTSNC